MPINMSNPQLMPQMVLDSINEGVYVTDKDRTIRYWGKAAERTARGPGSSERRFDRVARWH